MIEILVILFFIAFFVGGYIWFKILYNKDTVNLEDYKDQEFYEILNEGKEYLNNLYPNLKDKFKIRIYTGDDEGRITMIDSNNNITLCLNNILNENWMKDFNVIASEYNLPQIENIYEFSLFFLFHEFRHLLQKKGLAKADFNPLEVTEERKRKIIDYHLRPNESDCDWFGLIQLKNFKGESKIYG